jgi:hypothetical protein
MAKKWIITTKNYKKCRGKSPKKALLGVVLRFFEKKQNLFFKIYN